MKTLGKWLGGVLLALFMVAAVLLSPIAWVELACRGSGETPGYPAILPPEHHRAESRSLMTYPEWHIVHAYDDYARVIGTGDPHDFDFRQAVMGFWQALCPLNELSARHGGVTGETKATIYTIGVSFTAEMALKAAYEETLGRIATWIRGDTRAPLDDLTARQAADYARFLQQVPWYKWDFTRDATALQDAKTSVFRDRERALAVGLEYGAKSAYAGLIEQAVGQVGADRLTIRSVVTGLAPEALCRIDGVTVIATRDEGIEIETPRYRAFTRILADLAARGAEITEIAGNDDILLTLTAPAPLPGAVHAFARQGYGDTRSLLIVKLRDLAALLRDIPPGARLEHIHDY
ncbi:hypothetical protein [Oceaniglobus trochenteri]|uniref:hypothetical protein n=1 Tax=Oceaniglobus trochenteri TaxID=2763260 RepID=UPI001CFFA2CA|nr:hypothetical protein [Oceaniglobus trochenteri]